MAFPAPFEDQDLQDSRQFSFIEITVNDTALSTVCGVTGEYAHSYC